MMQRAPSTILYAHELVSEAEMFCELLQQIYTESTAALVQGTIPMRSPCF